MPEAQPVSCIFCKVIEGTIPSTKVFEDDNLVAFKDINPKAPIHIIIAPKVHLANLDEVTEENSGILTDILLTAKKLAEENGTSGKYKVVTNVGEMAGQTVLHMHFHLLGGWASREDVVSELKQ